MGVHMVFTACLDILVEIELDECDSAPPSVTVSGSVLQLSDDDSTGSSRMEREEEKE
jgi:hypothetical protein